MQRRKSYASKVGDGSTTGESTKANVEALELVVASADDVVAAVDCTSLAVFLSRKCDDADERGETKDTKAQMDEQKSAIIEALACKCSALLDIEAAEASLLVASSDGEGNDTGGHCGFKAAFAELRKWVDTATDPKHLLLHSRSEERAGRFASAYKVLDKLVEPDDKAADPQIAKRQAELLAKLGWSHWERHVRSAMLESFPLKLPPV